MADKDTFTKLRPRLASSKFEIKSIPLLQKSSFKAGVSNTRPAILSGNFKIINIYVAKCLEKICREIIEPNLNDTQCGFRPGRANTDQLRFSRKFLWNLGSMPKTSSTHAMRTSRKTGFLVKRFGECCESTVLTAACYWPQGHCVPAQKFVFVLRVKSPPFTVGLQQECVLSCFFS